MDLFLTNKVGQVRWGSIDCTCRRGWSRERRRGGRRGWCKCSHWNWPIILRIILVIDKDAAQYQVMTSGWYSFRFYQEDQTDQAQKNQPINATKITQKKSNNPITWNDLNSWNRPSSPIIILTIFKIFEENLDQASSSWPYKEHGDKPLEDGLKFEDGATKDCHRQDIPCKIHYKPS